MILAIVFVLWVGTTVAVHRSGYQNYLGLWVVTLLVLCAALEGALA